MDAVSSSTRQSSARPAGGRPPLEVRILGPFDVRRAGSAVGLGGARPRSLLALLAIRRGENLSVDRIVDELWGESPPPSARHMVEVYVSALRKALGKDRLVRGPAGYALALDAEELDAGRFERLRAEGREALAAGDAGLAAARLGEALALWRGPALADFAFRDFAEVEIARLEEARLQAEEERADAELARGGAGELVGELEELVARAPLRERRYAQLMIALVRAGRQAEALAAYRTARTTLVEGLGLEPGRELRELERAILAQEEALVGALELPEARADARESRRIVAVLFAELAREGAGADPEVARREAVHPSAEARAAVERHGGAVEELPDGTLMGIFGTPVTHEDDAVRAVRAAVELRSRGLAARMGIDCGEALAAGRAVSGEVFRSAARLREASEAGEIVLGAEARLAVGEAAVLEPIWEDRLAAWRLVEVVATEDGVPARTPLVGREAELSFLREAFEAAVAEERGRLVVVLGEAGIGKSRLAHELEDRVRGAAEILRGRCPAYGEGVTYWPLRGLIRRAGGDSYDAVVALLDGVANAGAIAKRVAGAVGLLDVLHPVEEIRWATTRLLETLARKRPLVLVVDDVQWAETAFLDLVDHVAARARAPILVLCMARDDLVEQRREWVDRHAAGALTLGRLSRDESGQLLAGLDGSQAALEASERRRIVAAAKGNPLFLEQLAAFAAERAGDRRHAELPPTLRALLAARLDRLAPGERAVMEFAAVAGRAFWVDAVRELVPPESAATFSRHLDALVGRELLEPRPSVVPFMQAFRFRHSLFQEAAYRALPKGLRADAHERLAGWIERAPRAAVGSRDRAVGHHLELAYRYRAELGPLDEELHELATRAARHLAAAGGRAVARGNPGAAAGLLARACALLPRGDPRRLELLPRLGVELAEADDPAGAEAALAQAVDEAVLVSDRRTELRARLELAALHGFAAPRTAAAEIERIAEDALPVFEEARDHGSLARAWRILGYVEVWADRWDAAGAAFERALDHAREAGDAREESGLVHWLARSLVFGSTPAPEAVSRCEELLERVAGRRRAEAGVLAALANLHAMQGHFGEARELRGKGGKTYADLGETARLARLTAVGTRIELLAGERDAAERELRAAFELYEASGQRGFLAGVAASLARIACEVGRWDEAERMAGIAEASASPGDATTQVRRRAAQAKVLARRGALPEAEALAREAVALTEETQFPDWQGDTLMDLADVLRLAGRAEEALNATRKALALYERKGNVASAARAREELAASAR